MNFVERLDNYYSKTFSLLYYYIGLNYLYLNKLLTRIW